MSTSSSVFNRAGPQSLSGEIVRFTAAINAVLEGTAGGTRLTRAREAVSTVRQERDKARADLYLVIRDSVDGSTRSREIQERSAVLEKHEAAVKVARVRLAEATAAVAPAMEQAMAAHLVVARCVVEELLDVLESALDPLTNARRFLSDHKFPLPRLVADAPLMAEHLRSMRAIAGGR
jgi:hypothetical protein